MKECHVYHGHSIDLDVSDIACARIRWTYFIDGRYCIQGATESMSIDAVRARALALAHRSIDVLESMRSGSGNVQTSRAADAGLLPATLDRGDSRRANCQASEARRYG
jgi:hypothetical protein